MYNVRTNEEEEGTAEARRGDTASQTSVRGEGDPPSESMYGVVRAREELREGGENESNYGTLGQQRQEEVVGGEGGGGESNYRSLGQQQPEVTGGEGGEDPSYYSATISPTQRGETF